MLQVQLCHKFASFKCLNARNMMGPTTGTLSWPKLVLLMAVMVEKHCPISGRFLYLKTLTRKIILAKCMRTKLCTLTLTEDDDGMKSMWSQIPACVAQNRPFILKICTRKT